MAPLASGRKKIGILGGMSPESTTLYYEHMKVAPIVKTIFRVQ